MATEKQNKWVQGIAPLNYVPPSYGGQDPMDFFTVNRPASEFRTHEHHLAAAVFRDAGADLGLEKKRSWRRGRHKIIREPLAIEAMQWFLKDDWDWPFSFVRLCELFGFQTEYLRRLAVEQWKTLYGYKPTVANLEERFTKVFIHQHEFMAPDHCVMCNRKEQKREYRREHPAPPRPYRKRQILGFSREDHHKLD